MIEILTIEGLIIMIEMTIITNLTMMIFREEIRGLMIKIIDFKRATFNKIDKILEITDNQSLMIEEARMKE